jgi:hypothetical protein
MGFTRIRFTSAAVVLAAVYYYLLVFLVGWTSGHERPGWWLGLFTTRHFAVIAWLITLHIRRSFVGGSSYCGRHSGHCAQRGCSIELNRRRTRDCCGCGSYVQLRYLASNLGQSSYVFHNRPNQDHCRCSCCRLGSSRRVLSQSVRAIAGRVFGGPRRESMIWIKQLRLSASQPRGAQPHC